MELELKRKFLKITIYGNEYQVRLPSMRDLKEYREKIEILKETDVLEVMRDFMANLGVPKDVSFEMDSDDFMTLVNFVCNPKKKT